MGVSHPLADELDLVVVGADPAERGPRRQASSPEAAPPLDPAECCIRHEVARMDTLAGIAIKYGVEISDIKRVNNLLSDSQMFAHKSLLIPLAGNHASLLAKANGRPQDMNRTRTTSRKLTRGSSAMPARENSDSPTTAKHRSPQQRLLLAMCTSQQYYEFVTQKGDGIEDGTEMASYATGSFQCLGREPFPQVSPARATHHLNRRWSLENSINGFSLSTNGISDTLASEYSGEGKKASGTEKSASMRSASLWSLNAEGLTKPLLDGLPKPISLRRSKAALD